MSCSGLAATGQPVLVLVVVSGIVLVTGLLVILLTRRRRCAGTALIPLLIVGVLAMHSSGTVAARASDCAPHRVTDPVAPAAGGPSLTIRQTSSMTGLAPGVSPVAITGAVTNTGSATVFVTAVTVTVGTVVSAGAASPNSCGKADFVVVDASMTVGRALAPGESVAFGGARIGLRDRPTNQDGCQRAVVSLHYLST